MRAEYANCREAKMRPSSDEGKMTELGYALLVIPVRIQLKMLASFSVPAEPVKPPTTKVK